MFSGPWGIIAIFVVALLLTGFSPGPAEIIIVLAIVLLLFGGKRIPELARGLGKSVTNFKAGLKEDQVDDIETDTDKDKETPQNDEVRKILD